MHPASATQHNHGLAQRREDGDVLQEAARHETCAELQRHRNKVNGIVVVDDAVFPSFSLKSRLFSTESFSSERWSTRARLYSLRNSWTADERGDDDDDVRADSNRAMRSEVRREG